MVSVAKKDGEVGLVAMMVVCWLTGCVEGCVALMDANVVAAIVEILWKTSSMEEE